MRFSTFVVAAATAFHALIANTVSAATFEVYDTTRLLTFRGPMRLGCYVDGTTLRIGQATRLTNPSPGTPIFSFEELSIREIKRRMRSSAEGRRVTTLRNELRDTTSAAARASLRRQFIAANRLFQRKISDPANAVMGAPCRDFHTRIVGASTPVPTAIPTETPTGEVNEMSENLFGSTQLDLQQFAQVPPSVDTTIIFVDAIEGNDTNNGFTAEDALRTVPRALSYLSSNAPTGQVDAHIYLRRGGSYALGGLTLSGRGRDAPLVIAAYGESGESRPRMAPLTIAAGVKNLLLTDLAFEAPSPGSGTAVAVTGAVENLMIQNCLISGFQNGIVVDPAGNQQAKEISIYRNMIRDLSSSTGPSFGVKLVGISRAIVSSNLFDKIGVGTTEESAAVSITGAYYGGVVRGNQFMQAPKGVVLTSNSEEAMAQFYRNAFLRIGTAGVIAARGVYMDENIVIEGSDVGTLDRGRGFDIRNASATQIYRTVVANTISDPSPEDFAFKFSGAAPFGFYDIAGVHVYNGGDIHMGPFSWSSNMPPFALTVKDSVVQNTRQNGANLPLVTIQGGPASIEKTQIRRLTLSNPADSSQRLYQIIEEGNINHVEELGYWSGWWFNRDWHCTGLELRVSPNLRKQSDNWYNGFQIHQDSIAHAVSDHDNPNRFEFNSCYSGYHNGPYTAQSRVQKAKWEQYANDEGSTIAPTNYVDPDLTAETMLARNNVGGTNLDDYVDYVAGHLDRGETDLRFFGQNLANYLIGGFRRP